MSEAIERLERLELDRSDNEGSDELVQPLGTAHSAEDRSALIWQPGNFRMAKYVEVVRFARIDEGKTKDSPRLSAITGSGTFTLRL